MSPHYEEQADLDQEQRDMQMWVSAVAHKPSIACKAPSGRNYGFDCYVFNLKDALCIVEYKNRKSGRWPVYLGKSKADAMLKYSEDIGKSAFFVVRLAKTGLWYIKLDRAKFGKYTIEPGKRNDRGDERDQDLVYLVPKKDFIQCSRKQ